MNFADLARFNPCCIEPDWCDGLDLDRNGAVNFVDFALSEGCCVEIPTP